MQAVGARQFPIYKVVKWALELWVLCKSDKKGVEINRNNKIVGIHIVRLSQHNL